MPSQRPARSPVKKRRLSPSKGKSSVSPQKPRGRALKQAETLFAEATRKSLISELVAASTNGATDQAHAKASSETPAEHSATPPPAAQSPAAQPPAAALEPTGRAAKGLILVAVLMMLAAYILRPFALKPSNVGVVDASKILKRSRLTDITKTPSMPLPASAAPGPTWSLRFFSPPPPEPPPLTLLRRVTGPFERFHRDH
jgi:hypothetical protein